MPSSDADIPESHWEILQERELMHAQGLDQPIPAEEAFRQIREVLRQDKILREEEQSAPPHVAAWPWELLEKRKADLKSGESRALPLKEVADRLRARRPARS